MSARRIAVLGAPGTGRTTLARELAARLDALALPGRFVIADPAPDTDEDLRGCDAVLLMGLDLPAAGDAALREAGDASLRSRLQRARVPFQVVYGSGPQRLQAALAVLESQGMLPSGTASRPAGDATRRWVWVCEKCSDPACEHRLFAQLRDRRG